MESYRPRRVVSFSYWSVAGLFLVGATILFPINMIMAAFASDSGTPLAILMAIVIGIWGTLVIATPAYLAYRTAESIDSDTKLTGLIWPIGSLSVLTLHPMSVMYVASEFLALLGFDSNVKAAG